MKPAAFPLDTDLGGDAYDALVEALEREDEKGQEG